MITNFKLYESENGKIKKFINTTIEEGLSLDGYFDYYVFDYDSLSDTANTIIEFVDKFDINNMINDDNLDLYFIDVMRDNIEITQFGDEDYSEGIIDVDTIDIATDLIYDHLKEFIPDIDEKYNIYINQNKYNL